MCTAFSIASSLHRFPYAVLFFCLYGTGNGNFKPLTTSNVVSFSLHHSRRKERLQTETRHGARGRDLPKGNHRASPRQTRFLISATQSPTICVLTAKDSVSLIVAGTTAGVNPAIVQLYVPLPKNPFYGFFHELEFR